MILSTSNDQSVIILVAFFNQYLMTALMCFYAIYKSFKFFEILGFDMWYQSMVQTLGLDVAQLFSA